MTAVPHNPEVEEALIGLLLARPELASQVAGAVVDTQDFYLAAHQLLFERIVESYYADEPSDPTTVAAMLSGPLGRIWGLDQAQVVRRVTAMAQRPSTGSAVNHAVLVRRDAEYRKLLRLTDEIRERVISRTDSPEEIAGMTGESALAIASRRVETNAIVPFRDAARAFVQDGRQTIALREAGVKLGAYYGLRAIDSFTRGHRGGELLIAGGEPGVGKSAVWWKAALSFARREATKPPGRTQIGTLIVSLEMGPQPSNARFASMLSGVPGNALREGTLTAEQLQQVISAWRSDVDVPLYMNYAPTLKASQLRALITEAIRKHNVGVVIIDHFRMFDLDRRLDNRNDEDEEKVRFLKEQIARSMDVAVVCLAHTRKPDASSNGRPKMSDLRGSYQVAAHSDFVSFIYRPAMYATQRQIDDNDVDPSDAEMIWAKNRHGGPGSAPFLMDGASMLITDRTQ